MPEDEVDADDVDRFFVERSTEAYTQFYRVAWRMMIAPDTERSLYEAIIPPGPAHIHMRSMYLGSNHMTALTAGFWASIPVDCLLRTTRVRNLDVAQAGRLPAPSVKHPLASALLFRALRLNCLTKRYAALWLDLYDPTWPGCEAWACDWPQLEPLHDVGPEWARGSALRTERARRAALVETDPAQPATPTRHFTVRLSATPRGARLGRHLEAEQLHTWGWPYDTEANYTVTLLVPELAANAAVHGHVRGRDFRLRLTRHPEDATTPAPHTARPRHSPAAFPGRRLRPRPSPRRNAGHPLGNDVRRSVRQDGLV